MCQWLALDKDQEPKAFEDQHDEPEVVPKQRGLQSPVVFSSESWIHQQSWLCEALRRMGTEQARDPVKEASCEPPDSGVSVTFDEEAKGGRRPEDELAWTREEVLRQTWDSK